MNRKNNSMLGKIEKDKVRRFKQPGIKISTETGLAKCNFLDVTLDIC